jgi:hypothetical protein
VITFFQSPARLGSQSHGLLVADGVELGHFSEGRAALGGLRGWGGHSQRGLPIPVREAGVVWEFAEAGARFRLAGLKKAACCSISPYL